MDQDRAGFHKFLAERQALCDRAILPDPEWNWREQYRPREEQCPARDSGLTHYAEFVVCDHCWSPVASG